MRRGALTRHKPLSAAPEVRFPRTVAAAQAEGPRHTYRRARTIEPAPPQWPLILVLMVETFLFAFVATIYLLGGAAQ